MDNNSRTFLQSSRKTEVPTKNCYQARAMESHLIPLETPCVYFDKDFLSSAEADSAYEYLLKHTKWEKTPKINRWVALYEELNGSNDELMSTNNNNNNNNNEEVATTISANNGYKYRDSPGAPQVGFNQTITNIKRLAEDWYRHRSGRSVNFNVCLLNFYEDGQQRIGWHSDREEIGRDTPIASISLGATRSFLIRSKCNGMSDRANVPLTSGSMVLMENICQHLYLHSVPRQPEVKLGRINLTFRCKQGMTHGEEEHERRDKWLENIINGTEPNMSGWAIASTAPEVVFGDGVQIGNVKLPINYVVRTNIGAECYCAAEIEELLSAQSNKWEVVAKPFSIDGFVACASDAMENDITKTVECLLNLKSAHHVMKYHDHFNLSDLIDQRFSEVKSIDGEALYCFFKQRLVNSSSVIESLRQLNKVGGSFRVSCSRIGGPHGFKAPDVEREIGGAMMEFYTSCIPKMEDYDVNVRVDVVGNMVIVGTQLNVQDLSLDRHFLKFRNAVTVKANLAYAMVRCAAIQPGDHVVDPFCGSGTLLLEALESYDRKIRCKGMDVSKRSTDGARENALAEGFGSDVCEFICTDARGLRRHLKDDSVDAIVTNLPWGVITGHKNVSDMQTMYEVFLRTSWYVLKDGARIVMLVLRGLQLTRIVRKLAGRYRLLRVNVVRTTNNLPCIVVVEKLGRDELRESVKGQLSYLSKYVNVSPEIYEAIQMETIDDDA